MNSKTKILSTLKKYFKNKKIIHLAYIFGSFLKQKNFNDIDIAILLDTKIPKETYNKIKLEVISDLIDLLKFNNIDLVILNELEDYLLANEIVTKGIVIYKKEKFLDTRFKAKITKIYIDFKFFLEKQFESLKQTYG